MPTTQVILPLLLMSLLFFNLGCQGFLERSFVCFPEMAHDGRPEDCYFPRNKSGKIRNIYKLKQPVV